MGLFRRTRIRLVLLNSIVFFLILNLFGATTYFYTQYREYNNADSQILAQAQHMEGEHFKDLLNEQKRPAEREADRRIVELLWSSQGKLVRQMPDNAVYAEDVQQLRPLLGQPGFQTVKLGGNAYRLYNLPVKLQQKADAGAVDTQTVQLIYNLESEKELLDHLLLIMVAGALLSALVAFVAGLFLANRALVPIQLAWNKQQQFVADASHELRTPLSVMKLQLEQLFRHPDHTIEQESENVYVAIQETRRMSKLVDDLLTLARSDSNQLQILQQKVQVDEIVLRVVQQFQAVAEMKEIQLETAVQGPIWMTGDEERLHQMLVILLDNALKYTSEAGRIAISCQRNNTGVHIAVEDTGVGIPKEDLPYVFDRFFRGDKARTRKQEGTGLGLSIAKWVVEAHGGRMRVESEVGKGTTVHIYLPVKTVGTGAK